MKTKTAVIIMSALVAALIVVGIVLVVQVNAMTAAARESEYRACVTAAGIQQSDDIDTTVGIAERCYSAVFGDG